MKNILCTLFLLAVLTGVTAQEMGFEEYNPTSTLVVPGHPVTRARYPAVDIHSHNFNMPTQDLSPVVRAMDSLNLAVLVNLSGASGDHLKGALDNVRRNYPNRFLVFANVDFEGVGAPDWGSRAAAQLEEDVRSGAVGLKIYKSLGLRYRDTDGNRIPVDDPRLDTVWEKDAALGIPVDVPAPRLAEALRGRGHALLVLDNGEHVAGALAALAPLVSLTIRGAIALSGQPALSDFDIEPRPFAETLFARVLSEHESMLRARASVRAKGES